MIIVGMIDSMFSLLVRFVRYHACMQIIFSVQKYLLAYYMKTAMRFLVTLTLLTTVPVQSKSLDINGTYIRSGTAVSYLPRKLFSCTLKFLGS